MTYPSPDDITAAAARIAGRVRKTPILSVEAGALGLPYPVMLKLEHTQVTGSFKVRGAFNTMLSREVPEAGVVRGLWRQSRCGRGLCRDRAWPCLAHLRAESHRPRREKLRRMRMFRRRGDPDRGAASRIAWPNTPPPPKARARCRCIPMTPNGRWRARAPSRGSSRNRRAGRGRSTRSLSPRAGGGLIGGIAAWFGDRVNVVSVETEGTDTLSRSLKEGPEIDVSATGVAAGSLGGPRLGVTSWEVIRDRVKTAIVLPDAEVLCRGKNPVGGHAARGRTGRGGGAGRPDLGRLHARSRRARGGADLRRQCGCRLVHGMRAARAGALAAVVCLGPAPASAQPAAVRGGDGRRLCQKRALPHR